jgi:fructokinase
VGLGTPGTPVRTGPHAGRMKNCNSTCLNGMPLQADVEAAIGQPVRIANDANCFALSEALDGAGAGAAVVFGVIAGTGVGGGLVVRGGLVEGAQGLAGEWGHNPLPWRDADADPLLPCYCGQAGCIETLVSGPGLAHAHALRHGGTLSAEAISAGAAQGDAACAATLALHASRLARALASLINVLDPDVIVLGGGLSKMAHLYTEVPRLWGRWVISAGASEPLRTRLVPPRWGDASGVRGAAWLWADAGAAAAHAAAHAAGSAVHRPPLAAGGSPA